MKISETTREIKSTSRDVLELRKIKELGAASQRLEGRCSNEILGDADSRLAARLDARRETEPERRAECVAESKPAEIQSKRETADLSPLSEFSEEVQTARLSEFIRTIPEIRIENWRVLSLEKRWEVLQSIENEAARIGGRPAFKVFPRQLAQGFRGQMDWENGCIYMNVSLLSPNNQNELNQTIKTLVHEGRHVYQFSNLYLGRVEPNNEKYSSWAINMGSGEGYMTAQQCGYRLYYLQPIEVDARTFSENIISRLTL